MTHLDLEQTLKTYFTLNLSAYKKFYLNRAFKGLYWPNSAERPPNSAERPPNFANTKTMTF